MTSVFRNYKAWLVLAAVMAALAAGTAVHLVRSFAGVVQVAAASRDLQPGEIVAPQAVTLVEQARGGLYPDAVLSPQEVAGMAARGFVPAGTVLRRSMFAPPQQAGAAGSLAALGPDYAAVAVPNTLATTVGGVLESGNRVDVYASPDGKAPPERLASDVLVLRAGTVRTREGEQQTPGVVLALRPDDLSRMLPFLTGGKEGSLLFVLKPLREGG